MSLSHFLRRARYAPPVAAILYAGARPVHDAAAMIRRQIVAKVRRNGGSADYDGIRITFPRGVGQSFLSDISWRGRDGFEPNTWRVLRRLIGEAGTFIDVGANVGFYSVLAHLVKPGIDTLSFEPLAHIRDACSELHAANGAPLCGIHQLALSDTDGEAVIYEPEHDHDVGASSASTLVSDGWQARKSPKTSVVKTARLDTLLEGRELRGPVAMKIDVEGFETAVLRGARETIARYQPPIVCEILPRPHGNVETLAAIDDLGYRPFAITEAGCFAVTAADVAKPRAFTDFLLLPASDAQTAGAFVPHS
jgi:FkbM family methyltransferase